MSVGYVYDEGEQLAKEHAARLMQEQAQQLVGGPVQLPHPYAGGTPLTPAAPLNDQIREIINDLADAADIVSERRQASVHATLQLVEAEKRYADLAIRMGQLLEQHRAAGAGLNSPKGLR